MSRYYSYLNTAKEVIHHYDNTIPLASWLKQFFAQRKQIGGRDRKEIASLVFQYYRLGKSVNHLSIDEKILLGIFLCNQSNHPLLELVKPEWNEQIHLSIEEKILLVDNLKIESIFPNIQSISEELDKSAFALSHLQQPNLFVRIRPKQQQVVFQKLQKEGIQYEIIREDSIALHNQTKLEAILEIDKDVVIQDDASQQIAEFIKPIIGHKPKLTVWDCCAASGGKSILAIDVLKNVQLTVSDNRESIIQNLLARFRRAGINNYQSFVADATKPIASFRDKRFDLIVCDAPCSGSGTWGRTPENLLSFTESDVKKYSELQKKIASNAVKYLEKDGYFLYITCSVFQAENEQIVENISTIYPQLSIVKLGLIEGYKKKGDNMFATLFKNNIS